MKAPKALLKASPKHVAARPAASAKPTASRPSGGAQQSSVLKSVASSATAKPSIGPDPQSILPGETESFSAYWGFLAAMLAILFIVYITVNNYLTQFLDLLVYAAPASVVPSGATAATQAPVPSGTAGASQISGAQAAGALNGLVAGTNPLGNLGVLGNFFTGQAPVTPITPGTQPSSTNSTFQNLLNSVQQGLGITSN